MATPNTVPITPDVLRERATITVPEAGALLSLGRRSAYQAAERGEIPCIRIGSRLVVPTAKLRAMLGMDDEVTP